MSRATHDTVYYSATTLDGFLADEHDSLDWLFVQEIDEDGPMDYGAFIATVGALDDGRDDVRVGPATTGEAGRRGPTTCRAGCSPTASCAPSTGADVAFVAGRRRAGARRAGGGRRGAGRLGGRRRRPGGAVRRGGAARRARARTSRR